MIISSISSTGGLGWDGSMVYKIEQFGDITLYFPCPNFGSLYLHTHYLFCDLPLTPCWYICIQIHIIHVSMPLITVVSMGAPRLSKCKKKVEDVAIFW